MTTIDQSDLSRILLALEHGLEVFGELRTSMNETFAGCRLPEDDKLELARVNNAHTDLHRASRIVTNVMAGRKPLHREMHQPFVDEIFMKLGAIDHDTVARGAVEGGR